MGTKPNNSSFSTSTTHILLACYSVLSPLASEWYYYVLEIKLVYLLTPTHSDGDSPQPCARWVSVSWTSSN